MEDESCYRCGGKSFEEIRVDREKYLKKFGWYADFVSGDNNFPYEINYHTHGILDNFNHLDFQIVFPIQPMIVHKIFDILVSKIKNENKKFKIDRNYSGIIENDYNIKFINAKEQDREILRIIFPDKYGNLDIDLIDNIFQHQYL